MKFYQPELLTPKIFGHETLSAWFSLKGKPLHDGVNIEGLNLGFNTEESAEIIEKNREILADSIETQLIHIAFANQVHGSDIVDVSKGGIYDEADGFITSEQGLALAIQVADCAAVLFGDSEAGIIAAVHAGWRGAVAGIVPKAVGRMMARGSEPEDIKVFISPCISTQNFEVGEEVAEQFPSQFVDNNSYVKPHVDLKGFIIDQLISLGVRESHIEANTRCTFADENLYSYRRNGRKSGRMMGIIKLNDLNLNPV